MGRNEVFYRRGEKERQAAQKLSTEKTSHTINPTEIIFTKPKSLLERHGYTTPERRDLHKRLDHIRQDTPEEVMQQAVDLFGARIISSIVAEGDPKNLDAWFANPNNYYLAGNTERSLTKIAVSLDFAKEMTAHGETQASIRKAFVERQPKLGDLSLSTALARIGPEEIGVVHEISQTIAKKDTQIRTEAEKTHAKRFAENYTLPSRGH